MEHPGIEPGVPEAGDLQSPESPLILLLLTTWRSQPESNRSPHSDSVEYLPIYYRTVILVAGPGIAPGTRAYETLEILLLQPATELLL